MPPPPRARSRAGLVLAGAVVIAGGVGVAVVEWLGFPKGSVWIVVAVTVALVVVIRKSSR
ncbi:MAG: hypothetical protein AUH30_02805 [Candidatus Rokubacteria bacterium 13_1_40CM_68_15]|nr:MAG: hypothetical protein AUH30_02805 [Candidatus Rokubacteria bacterium 13_1_40CM_68_15]